MSKVPDYVEKESINLYILCVTMNEHIQRIQQTLLIRWLKANKPENKMWNEKEMPKEVARLVREPGDPFAFGEGYHADITFFPEPPYFTFWLLENCLEIWMIHFSLI
eukprot:UN30233